MKSYLQIDSKPAAEQLKKKLVVLKPIKKAKKKMCKRQKVTKKDYKASIKSDIDFLMATHLEKLKQEPKPLSANFLNHSAIISYKLPKTIS